MFEHFPDQSQTFEMTDRNLSSISEVNKSPAHTTFYTCPQTVIHKSIIYNHDPDEQKPCKTFDFDLGVEDGVMKSVRDTQKSKYSGFS